MWAALCLVLAVDSALSFSPEQGSTVRALPGTLHGSYCTLTNAAYEAASQSFVYKSSSSNHEACRGNINTIWTLTNRPSLASLSCDRTFDVCHTYSVFYSYASDYFHVHMKTLMPLYAVTEWPKSPHQTEKIWEKIDGSEDELKTHIFMPLVTVENKYADIDWSTRAFDKENAFWVQMAKYPAYDPTSPAFVKSFSSFVKRELGIRPLPPFDEPVIGLIRRTTHRRITNEFELIRALNKVAKTVALDFYHMDYFEQVKAMQQLSVLIGMNGEGLINGIYLPPYGVAVQMVPYKANVNHDYIASVLRARGAYMEWHNSDIERHMQDEELDPKNERANTEVNIKEVVELAKDALVAAEEHRMILYRSEL